MRENNRNSIEKCRKKLPQFTTMNVIDGQAGLVIYSSLIFYSLTIDNILNIIVLLILAGVSIAMLTGQNGILTQAQKAKTTTENKSAEEKVKLAVMAAKSQSEDASLDLEKLTTEVTTNYGGQVDGGAFPATVTIDGKSFTVDSDGNVTSKDSETAGKITIIEGDGKSVGDIIEVISTKETKEKFYVLSYDESTQKAKALAKYNLMV